MINKTIYFYIYVYINITGGKEKKGTNLGWSALPYHTLLLIYIYPWLPSLFKKFFFVFFFKETYGLNNIFLYHHTKKKVFKKWKLF